MSEKERIFLVNYRESGKTNCTIFTVTQREEVSDANILDALHEEMGEAVTFDFVTELYTDKPMKELCKLALTMKIMCIQHRVIYYDSHKALNIFRELLEVDKQRK